MKRVPGSVRARPPPKEKSKAWRTAWSFEEKLRAISSGVCVLREEAGSATLPSQPYPFSSSPQGKGKGES